VLGVIELLLHTELSPKRRRHHGIAMRSGELVDDNASSRELLDDRLSTWGLLVQLVPAGDHRHGSCRRQTAPTSRG
jgi:hypothetical protein